jgi:hypothetical protein
MENLQGTGEVIRKVAIITLIGFLAVVLIGPVLTIAGVLLPFALVGLLVYVPYRLFVVSKQGGLPAVQQAGQKAVRTAVAFPVWVVSKVIGFIAFVLRTIFRIIGTIFGLVFAVGGGAAVGAILGTIGGLQYHDADARIPAGALIGAAVGLIIMLTRSRSSRVATVRPGPQVQQIHV